VKAKGDDGTSIGNTEDVGCRHITFSNLLDQINSMCYFMENIFMSTKYIQNTLENLEEAYISSKKRGVGVSFKGLSSSKLIPFSFWPLMAPLSSIFILTARLALQCRP